MYEWYKLDEAAAILTDTTGKPVGARDFLRMAFAGELTMIAAIPGWEAPGVGDLVLYALPKDPKCDGGAGAQVVERITSATNGFFCQLGRHDFQTLRDHGRLRLAGKVIRLPGLDGTEADWAIGPDAPTITLDDLRVSAAEIERLGSELAGTKAQPEPVVHQDEVEELTGARQGEAARRKLETQADRIEIWVGECERRAAAIGEAFDRARMPGTKADFLNLLHALDAELRTINSVSSLDRYLGGYKWVGGRQPSAAPLYARLFPDASIRLPGAVSR